MRSRSCVMVVGSSPLRMAKNYHLSPPRDRGKGAARQETLMCAVIDSPGEQGRVLQGIVTVIGFIGGGAMLKDDSRGIGTATAASIWNTGAIGVTVAYHLEIAIALSALNFFTLRYMGRLVRSVTGEVAEV
ncbi:MAG: MgtC/SapB family protein [Pseudomonadota bacterium]